MVCYLSIIFAKKPNCERKEEHCGHTWKNGKCFFLAHFTWGNKAQCKGVVEDVDVHFGGQNSSGKLDLGGKYEETGKEGKDCEDIAPQHVCYMKTMGTNIMFQNKYEQAGKEGKDYCLPAYLLFEKTGQQYNMFEKIEQ